MAVGEMYCVRSTAAALLHTTALKEAQDGTLHIPGMQSV